MIFDYNKADKWSILEFSKKLLGKTLEEAVSPDVIDPKRGKGQLGQLVEVYFFGIENNNRQEADFPEAGLELKVTPLKELKDKTLAIKERLVCTMIDFTKDQSVPFEKSHIYLKCAFMLIPFYLHKEGVPVQQLRFIYDVLWQIPEKDLLIMKQDYEKIIAKIQAGKAHELSEGDTTYLGACRKGQKGDSDVPYTLLDGSPAAIPAPKRAFSLKTQYMRTILEFAKKTGGQGTYNTSALVHGYGPHLIEESELRKKSFEQILLERFEPFYGLTYSEICRKLGVYESNAKHKYAMATNLILTENETKGKEVTKSEEFVKSGIVLKSIRVEKSGHIEQHMSFEAIDYVELMQEDDWYESRFYELVTQRFLFVVYRKSTIDDVEDYRLDKAFFWTMPNYAIEEAERFWLNIKENVARNDFNPKSYYKISDHKLFHYRPHGKDGKDMTINPNGGEVQKYGYWINKDLIEKVIAEA
jgi:DNA mismatch repair protein MutH